MTTARCSDRPTRRSRPRLRSGPAGTGCSSAWRRSPTRPPTTTMPPGAASGAGERRPVSLVRRPTTPSEEGERHRGRRPRRRPGRPGGAHRRPHAGSWWEAALATAAGWVPDGECFPPPVLPEVPGPVVLVLVLVAPGAAVVGAVARPRLRVRRGRGGAQAGPRRRSGRSSWLSATARCRRRGGDGEDGAWAGGTSVDALQIWRTTASPPEVGHWNCPARRSGTSSPPRHRSGSIPTARRARRSRRPTIPTSRASTTSSRSHRIQRSGRSSAHRWPDSCRWRTGGPNCCMPRWPRPRPPPARPSPCRSTAPGRTWRWSTWRTHSRSRRRPPRRRRCPPSRPMRWPSSAGPGPRGRQAPTPRLPPRRGGPT